MALYRKEVHGGRLAVTKRRWLVFWKWVVHYHEDAHMHTLRNRRHKLQAEINAINSVLPKVEKAYADELKRVMSLDGARTPPWRGAWTFRPRPVVSRNPNVKLEKKKSPQPPKRPAAMFEISPAEQKKGE